MPGAIDLLYFMPGQWLGFKTPSFKMPGKVQTHSPPSEESLALCSVLSCPKNAVAQHAHGGWSIVIHSKKLPPSYMPSEYASVLYSISVPEKQLHSGLSLLWQTVENSDQINYSLCMSLLSASAQHRHSGLSLLWLITNSC